MPGMSGPQLAERLTRLRPGLKVLFVSGYPHDRLQAGNGPQAPLHFLRKPFSSSELLGRVRMLLGAHAA